LRRFSHVHAPHQDMENQKSRAQHVDLLTAPLPTGNSAEKITAAWTKGREADRIAGGKASHDPYLDRDSSASRLERSFRCAGSWIARAARLPSVRWQGHGPALV